MKDEKFIAKYEYNKKAFARKKQLGLCVQCVNIVVIGQSRCEKCLSQRRSYYNLKRKNAEQKNLCTNCFKSASLENSKFCEICYYKRTSLNHFKTIQCWKYLKEKFQNQNEKCALSGLIITLGLNAELDHITPRSQQGCDELENVQWILSKVNHIKAGLVEKDLFILIKSIYETMRSRFE